MGQGPGEVGVRAEGQTVRFVRCQGSRGGYQGADRPRLERRERREADSCRHGRRFIGGRMWRGRPVERHYAAACRARRKRTGRPVAWRTVGKLGATARRVRYRMIGDINDRPDVLIVCVGSNDMLAGRSVRENGPLTSPRCWTRPRTRPAGWCTLLLVTPSTTAAKPSVMISPSSLSDWSDLLPWQCCSMMCIAIFDSMVVRTLKGVYWLIMMAAVTCGYGGRCLNESATPFRLEIVQITSERVLHFHLDSGGTIEKS